MSRMVRFHAFGGAEVLKLDEVAVPAPGIGEVRIAVQAIGLNRADALWRENLYIEDATLPAGLGNEAAGVIEAVGEGVEGLGVGDRVAVLPGASQGLYPTYGDRILFPAAHVVRYPDNLSAAQAAGAYMAYLTGYFPMLEMARLQRGQVMLVTGASSGTGIAALQPCHLEHRAPASRRCRWRAWRASSPSRSRARPPSATRCGTRARRMWS